MTNVHGVSAIELQFENEDDRRAFVNSLGDPNDGYNDVKEPGLCVVKIYGKQDWQEDKERMWIHEYMYHEDANDTRNAYFSWAEDEKYRVRFFIAIEEKAKEFGKVTIRECLFDFEEEELERYTGEEKYGLFSRFIAEK